MPDQDSDTQIVQLPFTGGIDQKTQSEWIDPQASQTSIVNGVFANPGAISKRAGMGFVSTISAKSQAAAGKLVSWSRQPLGAALTYSNGDAYLASVNLDFGETSSLAAIPSPRSVRTALTSIPNATTSPETTSSITPVIVDCSQLLVRLVFTVIGSATYVEQFDLVTGSSLGAAQTLVYAAPASAITGFYTLNQTGPQPICEVLLQVTGSPAAIVGFMITGLGTPSLVVSHTYGPTQVTCADMAPLVGDPEDRFVLYYQLASTGAWTYEPHFADWTYDGTVGVVETSGLDGALCAVSAVYDQGIAFLYVYEDTKSEFALRFASYSGDMVWTPVDVPYTVGEFSQACYPTGLCYQTSKGQFIGGAWQLQTPNQPLGIAAPQWLPLAFTPGTSLVQGTNPPMTSYLGMFPVGRPFVLPTLSSAVFQPVVSQFQVTPIAPGSSTVQSEQCTLYLLNLTSQKIVSTVAPRQVDPVFSYQWLEYPTACLPQSSYDSLRFAVGLNTQSEDVPGVGYSIDPSWVCDWMFDGSSQTLLYDSAEVAGALHLSASVPMTGDGSVVAEDSFFYYPEFALAQLPLTEVGTYAATVWPNPSGTYNYAVCYSYVDGTGQVAKSSPVFTNPATGELWSVEVCSTTTTGSQTLPAGTINVTSTTGLAHAGGVWITTTSGPQWVSYSGVTPTSLTGCFGGTGTTFSGGLVQTNAPQICFPPYATTYKSSVNAEIYRTTDEAGVEGAVYQLVQTVSGQYQTPGNAFGVATVQVAQGGSYASLTPPTVAFTAIGPGSGAQAVATLGGGGIAAVAMSAYGEYTVAPLVAFTGSGTGATAVAVLGPVPGQLYAGVLEVRVTNPGTGYGPGTAVTFSGGSGSGASATVSTTAITVTQVTVTHAGSGYTTAPTVSFSSGTATAISYLALPASTLNNLVYTDQASDQAVSTASFVYTTGGVLDCVNPPTANAQTIHWGRKWIVDETGTTIWFTKQFALGEAPGFNEALTIYYPDGGPITALASMDDKLVIFKAGSISVVYGQGPSNNAQGNDLTEPQPIATDTGALDWRSVVLFPGGLFFQGKTGLYVLDRSLNVTWVGKELTDTLGQYSTVLSSCLVPSATHVRFSCQNPTTLQTIVLVYDYLVEQWTTFTYARQPAPLSDSIFVSSPWFTLSNQAPVLAGFYATLTSDGSLWRERDAVIEGTAVDYWEDEDTRGREYFVPTSITTAWVKLQGVQGYQRLRRIMALVELPDKCGMTMGLAVNYNPAIVQTAQWDYNTLWQLPVPQVEMHCAAQYNKQMAVQVTLTDQPGQGGEGEHGPRVTNEGAVWVSLALELQSIGDRYPGVPPAGRR